MFSDHGDWAGDYGLVEKWTAGLDDCLTRVPLIIRLCKGKGATGHVVSDPMELMDIMPTVLELAGIQPRHTHFGRSLVPQLHGAGGDPDRAVFAEGGYALSEPHCFEGRADNSQFMTNPEHIYYQKGLQQQEEPDTIARCAMIRTSEHKLVRRSSGQHELYDLQSDPGELENVYRHARYADIRADLEARMLDWYLRTSDVVPLDEDSRELPHGAVTG